MPIRNPNPLNAFPMNDQVPGPHFYWDVVYSNAVVSERRQSAEGISYVENACRPDTDRCCVGLCAYVCKDNISPVRCRKVNYKT